MKPAERYIDDVMRGVFAAAEDRERLEADLRSHFAEAEATGRAPREVIEGLGTPEEVAAAFNAEREFQYASFWQRLVAFFGDAGLLMFFVLPLLGLGLMAGVVGEEGAGVGEGLLVQGDSAVTSSGAAGSVAELLEDVESASGDSELRLASADSDSLDRSTGRG